MSTPENTSGPSDKPVNPTRDFEYTLDSDPTPIGSEYASNNDNVTEYTETDYPEPASADQSSEPTDHDASATEHQPSNTAAFTTSKPDENPYQTGYSTPIATAERTPTETAPTQPWSAPVEPEESFVRAVRMRTVVFGLVLLVIAGAVLVGQLTDITVDAGAVVLALMIGCGVLLLVGARRS